MNARRSVASGAEPPGGKEQAKIRTIDITVPIEIRWPASRSPGGKEQTKIVRLDLAIAVQVSRTVGSLALIGDTVTIDVFGDDVVRHVEHGVERIQSSSNANLVDSTLQLLVPATGAVRWAAMQRG